MTSLTDVVVFGIGAITYFPSMQSFSIGGALAIAIIYMFQSSWFIAWMVLDQRRIEQGPYSIENFSLEFLIEKQLEVPYSI